MSGICKKNGFTLIEILVVIAIMMVMATVIVPNLSPRKAADERASFIAQLNTLLRFAWQNALISHAVHKVVFDLKHKKIFLEQATDKKNNEGDVLFKSLGQSHFKTALTWPDNLVIKNFYIEGFDEMKRSVDGSTLETWFFIVPDGLAQHVTINIVDTKDLKQNGRQTKVGLVLNPFNAQFVAHDTFKK